MKPFTIHTGIVATLNRANIDTDAIIPKQFLKSIKRTGYGPNAFFDWRYTSNGKPNPDFELNQKRFEGRSILVTGNNFGCGSSREHAVWALIQDGYRAIIAPEKQMGEKSLPAFADIFRINAAKNGLLAIELSEDKVNQLFGLVESNRGLKATIDLAQQTIVLDTDPAQTFEYDIESDTKVRLLNGMDDIAQTLRYEKDITRFEKSHDPLRS